MVKIINHSKEKIEQKRKEIEKEIEQSNKNIAKHNYAVFGISIAVADKFNVGKTIDKIYKLGENLKSLKSDYKGFRMNYQRGYSY